MKYGLRASRRCDWLWKAACPATWRRRRFWSTRFHGSSNAGPVCTRCAHLGCRTQRFEMKNIVYFDLETQKSAGEVGGWNRKRDMLMSVGVTYSVATGQYKIFSEAQVNDLIKELTRADRVIGFNIINFDYEVLAYYSPLDLRAKPTLQAPKIADGLQALRWWKEGKLIEIAEYCCFDVKITKELHEYGRDRGEVFYVDRMGQK